MRYLRLGLVMLRPRAAQLLLLLFLLGLARHGGLERWSWGVVWALLCLASSYVVATSLNDLADREIDRVNLPGRASRPLAGGVVAPRDLVVVAVGAAVMALGSGIVLGPWGAALAVFSLGVDVAYSLRPLRFSRTLAALPVLATAYSVVPFGLGLATAGAGVRGADLVMAAGLWALCLARMSLKDFRDREGDRRHGKLTFLLAHGKTATCLLCLGGLLAGDALLMAVLAGGDVWLVAAAQGLVAGMALALVRCWRSLNTLVELSAIGSGARLGNGLLLTLLAALALRGSGAPEAAVALVAWLLAAAFLVDAATRLRRPA